MTILFNLLVLGLCSDVQIKRNRLLVITSSHNYFFSFIFSCNPQQASQTQQTIFSILGFKQPGRTDHEAINLELLLLQQLILCFHKVLGASRCSWQDWEPAGSLSPLPAQTTVVSTGHPPTLAYSAAAEFSAGANL